MGAAPAFVGQHLPWIAAVGLFAVVAVLAGAAAAVNTPPREGCGALTIEAEMEQLNATLGLQGRFLAVNVTMCDQEDPSTYLNATVESVPAANWTVRHYASGFVALVVESPTNEMVGTNRLNVTICDSMGACTTERFHLLVENMNDPPRVSRIQVTELDTNYSYNLTVNGSKFSARGPSSLRLALVVDDPDLHDRAGEPGIPINRNETRHCELHATFRDGGAVPADRPLKVPTVDPIQCVTEYEVPPDLWGEWRLAYTVRDAANSSSDFIVKLEVAGVVEEGQLRILTPVDNFVLEPLATVNVSVSLCSYYGGEAPLTIVWTIGVEGGRIYTVSGKTANVAIENYQETERAVTITVTVSEPGDGGNPVTVSKTIQGTIKGRSPPEEGFPVTLVLFAGGLAALGGWLLVRRRRGTG
jgi:hypothetical protein